MRNDIKRFAVAVLAALFSLQTSAAVFLKAAGVNEERATLDGTSWAWANAPCFCSAEPLEIDHFMTNCTWMSHSAP